MGLEKAIRVRCPNCGEWTRTKVVDVRYSKQKNHIRRRRECLACVVKFSTVEMPVERIENAVKAERLLRSLESLVAKIIENLDREEG